MSLRWMNTLIIIILYHKIIWLHSIENEIKGVYREILGRSYEIYDENQSKLNSVFNEEGHI